MLLNLRSTYRFFLCFLAGLVLALTACSQDEIRMEMDKPGSYNLRGNDLRIIDPDLKLSRKAYKDKLLPPTLAEKEKHDKKDGKQIQEPDIPEISDLIVAPPPPPTAATKLVSLSVTEDIPLKDVLLELARLADIGIELDPKIKGGIILRVKDRPLQEVVERISQLANLRYSFDENTLHISRDLPYIKNYNVDFLNLARSGSTDATLNTSVVSEVDDAGKIQGSVNSGTTNKLVSQYDGDLWGSITKDLANILGLDPKDLTGLGPTSTGKSAKTSPTNVIEEALTGGEQAAAAETEELASKPNRPKNFLSINKQAGVITARGTDHQQKAISEYLKRVKETVSAQVLIEAKVVEVTLDQDYSSGINWDIVDNDSRFSLTGGYTEAVSGQNDVLTVGVLNSARTELATAVSLTEFFGASHTLSSPRLHAMNNQQAVLSFATNEVYFTLDVQEEEQNNLSSNVRRLNVDSQVHTVPIGIILTLQPSIDLKTNEITMNIRPTLSRITRRVEDPGVTILAARNNAENVSSTIPVVEVREMDSTLKIKSGQVMVIGGLMEERAKNNETGIPFFSTLPLVGNLLRGASKQTGVVETVIFIKATIVPGTTDVPNADKHLYNTFIRDPRPLSF